MIQAEQFKQNSSDRTVQIEMIQIEAFPHPIVGRLNYLL